MDIRPAPVPLPSPESLAHRARLASLISPLKRVRPRVPFWELAAHRVPTLWSLYRGLLKHAPGENLKWRVKMLFQKNRYLTSPQAAHERLLKGHQWLDMFVKAKQGDGTLQTMFKRHEHRIALQREKDRWKEVIRIELADRERTRRRPIVTGAYFRPTLYNRPLPRLKPQPEHITMMIKRRRDARERRTEKYALLDEWRDDLRLEKAFELNLLSKGERFDRVFSDDFNAWDQPLLDLRKSILATFERDTERLMTPFPSELLQTVQAARRNRVIYHTRQLERERHGEVTPRTIRRRRKGPPAHVLAKMTPQQRVMDKISRSVSEVGYVGMVKRRLGWKLKNPKAGMVDIGEAKDRRRLDQMAKEVEAENARRRKHTEESSTMKSDSDS